MRQTPFLITVILFYACTFSSAELETASLFKHENLNDGWNFQIMGEPTLSVNLPHTPRIEPLIVNNQWQGKHSYTRELNLLDDNPGKTFLHFEGVMHDATVFVNGAKVKKHAGGYLPFSIDISDIVQVGKNEIRVDVSNQDNSAIPPGKPLQGLDFNYYGGIYRDVWLTKKGSTYITDPFIENTSNAGWLIHFDEINRERAKGIIRLQIRNESLKESHLAINIEFNKNGKTHVFKQTHRLNSDETQQFEIPITIKNPAIWSTTSPNLYDLSIQIKSAGKVTDLISDKIGIRKIELTREGFFLNDQKQFLRGTNRHQEYPYVGYAISNNANFRDALKIKNAGFDFVRLSHYPQDESFLDACDELGILVMNAIPGWQHYQEGEFVQNSFQDIRDMVRRDRNHPSVIFWEASLNESGMTDDYMIRANEILKEELPFDDTYSAGWIDHPSYDLFIPARQHSKPPHYWNNYKDGERPVFIAEYGDWEYYAHNAGFNQTAFADLSDEERNSRQLRTHGEKRLLQQALNFQEAANSNRKGIGTIGHANWLMFDYNRGYANDLEASGISDIFRIPKFAYYFYRSQRPPQELIDHPLVDQGPMVKIASYWTENSPKNIRVFSNCEKVRLYLNDSLIAVKGTNVNELSDQLAYPPFEFKMKEFKPGTLKAQGLIAEQVVGIDSVCTAGEPYGLRIRIDSLSSNHYDDNDLLLIYAEIIDKQGTMVPTASNLVNFDSIGNGKLIGENPIKAEAGIATILFRGDPEDFSISASSKNLRPTKASNKFTSLPTP